MIIPNSGAKSAIYCRFGCETDVKNKLDEHLHCALYSHCEIETPAMRIMIPVCNCQVELCKLSISSVKVLEVFKYR